MGTGIAGTRRVGEEMRGVGRESGIEVKIWGHLRCSIEMQYSENFLESMSLNYCGLLIIEDKDSLLAILYRQAKLSSHGKGLLLKEKCENQGSRLKQNCIGLRKISK